MSALLDGAPVERLREALERHGCHPQLRGKTIRSLCPGHDDHNPSLDLDEGSDGRALLNCRSQRCSTEDIIRPLGLTMADLFPPKDDRPMPSGRTVEATYRYVDEDGRHLYTVKRYRNADGGKDFRQFRADGTAGIKGVRRVLWQLPKVLDAIAGGETVYLVEGEKCVQALERLGFTATCSSGGAKGWRPELDDQLKGAHVVVIPDEDGAGEEWARTVLISLKAEAESLKLARIALHGKGDDIADHLAAGHGMDDLELADVDTFLRSTAATARPEPRKGRQRDAREDADDDWDEPIPLDVVATVPPFPVEVLPDWLGDFVERLADSTQTPPDLAGMLAITVVAACAGGRMSLDAKADWKETLNLYTATAMASGELKSPVFDTVLEPLNAFEDELRERVEPAIVEAQSRRRIAEKALAAAEADAGKANLIDRRELSALAVSAALEVEETKVPALPVLSVTDTTSERMGTLLHEQGGRMAFFADEGGAFAQIVGRYEQGNGAKRPASAAPDVWLHGHNGGRVRVERVGRPADFVPRACITIGLAVQPTVLQGLANVPGLKGRGLLARFLYSIPSSRMGYRNVDPEPVPASIAEQYRHRMLSLARTACGMENRRLRLSRAALAASHGHRRTIEPRLRPGGDLRHMSEWAGKLHGAIARLAALLYLADHAGDADLGGLEVSADAMHRAIRLGTYLLDHARVAHDLMGSDAELDRARLALEWLAEHRPETVTRRDVMVTSSRSKFPTADDTGRALETLADFGWLRARDERVNGRAATNTRYDVHPSLVDGCPDAAPQAPQPSPSTPEKDLW